MQMRVFDMTVPLEVVRQLPQLPDAGSRTAHAQSDPKLILPRLRYFDQPDEEITAAYEREYEDDEQRTRQRTRRHEVTWHVRRLPHNQKPPALARSRADSDGIVLEAHETFVKKHDRGGESGESNPIHRATYRNRR